MLKISSNLVRQVSTPLFDEVVKKKAVTKKVCRQSYNLALQEVQFDEGFMTMALVKKMFTQRMLTFSCIVVSLIIVVPSIR